MSAAVDSGTSERSSTSSSFINTPADSARPAFSSRHSYSQTHRIPTALHHDYNNDPLLSSSPAGFSKNMAVDSSHAHNKKPTTGRKEATTSFSHVSFSGTMSPRRRSHLSRSSSSMNNHLMARGYKSTPNIAGLQQHDRLPTSSSSVLSDDNNDIFLRTGVRMAQECDEYRGQGWLASRDSSLENLVEIQEFINPHEEADGNIFKQRGSKSYPLLGAIIDEQPFFKKGQENVIGEKVQAAAVRKGLPMSLNVALEATSTMNSAALSQDDDDNLAKMGSGFGKWLDWITDLGRSPAEAEGINGDDSNSEEEDVKSANILNGQFARCRVSSGMLSRRGMVKPPSSGSMGGSDLDNSVISDYTNSSPCSTSGFDSSDILQNEIDDTPAWARRDAEQEWQVDGVAMFCYWARFAGRFLGA